MTSLDDWISETYQRNAASKLFPCSKKACRNLWSSGNRALGFSAAKKIPRQYHMAATQHRSVIDSLSLSQLRLLPEHTTSMCLALRLKGIMKSKSSKTRKTTAKTETKTPANSLSPNARLLQAVGTQIQQRRTTPKPNLKSTSDSTAIPDQELGLTCFARGIISAWALTPISSDSTASIREYANSKWRKVPWGYKSRWQALFEDRYNFGTDVADMARRLLKSHNLLAQVVPQDRLRAVELDLRKSPSVPRSSPPTMSGLTSTPGFEQSGRLPSPGRSEAGNHTPDDHHDAPSKTYTSGWLTKPRADFSGSEEISQVFPRLVQAAPDTPITQACIVPTSTRNHKSRRCLFILNTPDVRAYSDLTEHDLCTACECTKLSGLKDVTRLSQNIFEVAFRSFSNADPAYQTTRISIEVPPTTFTPFRRLNIRADWNWKYTFCVYVCDVTKLPINHQTVIERVFDALQGPLVNFFSLHK